MYKTDAKNKGYQEKMLFDWNIQLEKVQLTRDLKDDTIFYQIVPLSCKIYRISAFQQKDHKQLLFGSLKTHVPEFKLQVFTQEG